MLVRNVPTDLDYVSLPPSNHINKCMVKDVKLNTRSFSYVHNNNSHKPKSEKGGTVHADGTFHRTQNKNLGRSCDDSKKKTFKENFHPL